MRHPRCRLVRLAPAGLGPPARRRHAGHGQCRRCHSLWAAVLGGAGPCLPRDARLPRGGAGAERSAHGGSGHAAPSVHPQRGAHHALARLDLQYPVIHQPRPHTDLAGQAPVALLHHRQRQQENDDVTKDDVPEGLVHVALQEAEVGGSGGVMQQSEQHGQGDQGGQGPDGHRQPEAALRCSQEARP